MFISIGGPRTPSFSRSSSWRMIQTGQRRRRRYAGAVQSAGMSRQPMRFPRSTGASVAERGTLPLIHGRPLTVAGSDATGSSPAALTNVHSFATLGPAHPALRQCSRLATVASLSLSLGDALRPLGLAGKSAEGDLAVELTSVQSHVTLETVSHVSAPQYRAVNARRPKSQGPALRHSSSVATHVEPCSPVAFTTATTFAILLALVHPALSLSTDTAHVASLLFSFLAQRRPRHVVILVARLLVVAATLVPSAATEVPARLVCR